MCERCGDGTYEYRNIIRPSTEVCSIRFITLLGPERKVRKMANSSSSSSSGIGFGGLLTVLFVGLKLTDHIDWSWWWVLAPLWMPIAIVIGVLLIVGVIWLLNEVRKSKRGNLRA